MNTPADIIEIERLLSLDTHVEIEALFSEARKIKHEHAGSNVYPRALIEVSNICTQDCFYCGIRKSNRDVKRYELDIDEIMKCVDYAWLNKIPSLVLQAGERSDQRFVSFIESVTGKIQKKYKGNTAITLSLGEQTEDTYRRWFDAGASRYLLRIETSNKRLFSKIHPPSVSFDKRKNCLELLKKTGYQVGTGVMIGLPGQTLRDLAEDIMFFKKMDVDMIGMGPYIPHGDTPLGNDVSWNDTRKKDALILGLKMIAVTRIVMKDINIASTTALEALAPDGRFQGLRAGANVIMPNITGMDYKKHYLLYSGKPVSDRDVMDSLAKLDSELKKTGDRIAFGEIGTSRHFKPEIRVKKAIN